MSAPGGGPPRAATVPGPTATFWSVLGAGRLTLQRCSGCTRCFHRPRRLCPYCGSTLWAWEESAGEGTVYSATTVARPVGAFAEEGSYTIVMVDLDEGARVIGRMGGATRSGTTASIGERVRFVLGIGHDGSPRIEFERA